MTPYYQDDLVTLYHCDAREMLPSLVTDPARTLVVTDPPWPGARGKIAGGGDEAVPLWREVSAMIPRLADRLVLHLGCMTDPRGMVDAVPLALPFARVVYLRFIRPAYRGPHIGGDVAYVFGAIRRPPAARVLPGELIAQPRDRWRGEHPCPRNIGHVDGMLRWYGHGADMVVEPFAGAGTTLRAARARGIRAIGCEVEERWCEETAEGLRVPWQPAGLDLEVRP